MSKNAMWLTIIVIAAFIGAFIGPLVASLVGDTTMTILAPILLIATIGFCIWALSSNKSGEKADTAALTEARAMRAPEAKRASPEVGERLSMHLEFQPREVRRQSALFAPAEAF